MHRLTLRSLFALALTAGLCGSDVAGAAVRRESHGIRFSARLAKGNRVVIRWNASRRVRRQASSYDFQIWYDDEWYSFLGTYQPTSGRIPVVAQLPTDDRRFCIRMVAYGGESDDYGDSEIVGSGMAGNDGPCL